MSRRKSVVFPNTHHMNKKKVMEHISYEVQRYCTLCGVCTHTHTHTHTHTLSPPPSDLHQSEVGLGRHVRQCSSHLEWISGPLLRRGAWTGHITSWPRR